MTSASRPRSATANSAAAATTATATTATTATATTASTVPPARRSRSAAAAFPPARPGAIATIRANPSARALALTAAVAAAAAARRSNASTHTSAATAVKTAPPSSPFGTAALPTSHAFPSSSSSSSSSCVATGCCSPFSPSSPSTLSCASTASRTFPSSPPTTSALVPTSPNAIAPSSPSAASSSGRFVSPPALSGQSFTTRTTAAANVPRPTSPFRHLTGSTPSSCSVPSTSFSAHTPSLDLHVPLLDPWRPNSAALLLKAPKRPTDSAVWLLQTGRGGECVIAKQTPFYTPRQAALAWAIARCKGRVAIAQATAVIVTESQARHESATAAASALRDEVYVPTIAVFDREYTRETLAIVGAGGGGDGDVMNSTSGCCTPPDREVIAVYPYFPSGDAAQFVDRAASELASELATGGRSLEEVVGELSGLLLGLACDMFELVSRAHELGYVLVDHKLENMVYDTARGRWRLTDAAAVQRCRLGSKLPGFSRCTTFYAAPEQRDGRWSDSRSDVFACGRSVQMAVSDCLDRLAGVLGGKCSEAFAEAQEALSRALEPLAEVVVPCTEGKDPAARPSAAEALAHLISVQ